MGSDDYTAFILLRVRGSVRDKEKENNIKYTFRIGEVVVLFPVFFFFPFLFRLAASPVQAGFCLHGVKSCVNYSESQLQPSLLQAGENNKEITTCRKGIKTMSTTVRFLLQTL